MPTVAQCSSRSIPPASVRTLLLAALLALASACAGDAATGTAPTASDDVSRKGNGNGSTPASGDVGVSPFAGASLWLDPASPARRTADGWRATRPADAAQLEKLARESQVRWFGNWNTDIAHEVDAATTTMTAAGALPVFVAYNIPQRDCGGMSGDNTTTASGYRTWIAGFAAGLAGRHAAVILEPDALASMGCLSATDQQARLDLINYAVQTLRANGSVAVYLDAGNPSWQPASVMATRLSRAGIAAAQGFALNVSNFLATPENVRYGRQISALVGDKHFIVDTGRNGLGGNGAWCNPAGRALGERPTTQTGQALVDAYLWVKAPGESDGACTGAPASGEWMPEYALGLAQRAAY